MSVLAVAMRKGGVGKTHVCVMCSGEHAHQGKRVVIIDMDDQCSLTKFFLPDEPKPYLINPSVYHVLAGECALLEAIRTTAFLNISIIPGHKRLEYMDHELTRRGHDGVFALRYAIEALQASSHAFDEMIIDTPGSTNMLTTSALSAANILISPVEPGDELCLDAVPSALGFFEEVQKQYNPDLHFAGFFINKYARRVRKQTVAVQALRSADIPLLATEIPHREVLRDAIANGKPIRQYRKTDPHAELYTQLLAELGHAHVN